MRTITRLTLAVVITAMSFTSCYQEAITDAETTEVSVCLNDFQIESPSTSNTRASNKTAVQASINFITLKVFDKKGNVAHSETQSIDDQGFGTLKFRLSAGEYKFVAVAHSGTTSAATITSATSAEIVDVNKVYVYSCVMDVTITGNTSQSVTMDMGKCDNAVFCVSITDSTPENIESIQIIVSPTSQAPESLKFSPTTGLSTAQWRYERTFSKTEYKVDTFTGKKLFCPFLISSAETQLDVQIKALDSDDTEIFSRTLSGVTFKSTMSTTATGTFFSSATTSTFQFDVTTEDIPISLD